MNTAVSNPDMVAYCGLYCAACGAFRKGRCPGCQKNAKASWCGVRKCCLAAGRRSCADCADFVNPGQCRKFNNLIAKIFGLIFRSDRAACIRQIRELGIEGHAAKMAEAGRPSIRR